jgi:hypothetical protein
VAGAVRELGLSPARVYALVRAFRQQPVTAALVPATSGPRKGGRRLDPEIEARVNQAIEEVYLKPERPTLKRVLVEIRRDCSAAGLKSPSMKALRARVTARSLRERVQAREGAEAAGDRFRQVKIGLRTERPLQVVQIDHTKVDIMLVDDVTRACIGRPWLTLVLDVHTRTVLGVLTFQEFERILTLEVLGPYRNEIHAALGRTPGAAWAESASSATRRDAKDAAALLRDFLPFEERLVRRDGIRLFNIRYQHGALAHLVDHGVGKLRVKYDPRNLSAVFVEPPAGEHIRVPYADLGRLPITLWEHREATQRLRAEGRRSVDEHTIFAAVAEQRRVLMEAQARSKAARRAVARIDSAGRATATPKPGGEGQGAYIQGAEAKVPMPRDGETSGVEFW